MQFRSWIYLCHIETSIEQSPMVDVLACRNIWRIDSVKDLNKWTMWRRMTSCSHVKWDISAKSSGNGCKMYRCVHLMWGTWLAIDINLVREYSKYRKRTDINFRCPFDRESICWECRIHVGTRIAWDNSWEVHISDILCRSCSTTNYEKHKILIAVAIVLHEY